MISVVQLLQAHLFNYDIISSCEISLNSQMETPNPLMEGYNFDFLRHLRGSKRSVVGIFYKENIPLMIRHGLCFEECLVSEIYMGKKKIFHCHL